jgi:ADP-ribosylglycohydrolase
VEGASKYGEKILPETLGEDRLTDRLHTIDQPLTSDQIALNYGGGSCYVYNSLPFSYAFFLRNPNSIETLYDVVSAGGDTDSNGSIVGSLLGALHGTSIFPKYLTDALDPTQKALLEDVTNRFIEKFCK